QARGPGAARGCGAGRPRRCAVVQGPPRVIAIVDYGVGNVRSVERALVQVGAEPKLTADAGDLELADGLVLPGVGAFAPALDKLTQSGLGRRVVELAGNGKPVLGV